eukprot:COSAG02_NODE_246_length_27291_cov_105.654200_6_plen_97_part_00
MERRPNVGGALFAALIAILLVILGKHHVYSMRSLVPCRRKHPRYGLRGCHLHCNSKLRCLSVISLGAIWAMNVADFDLDDVGDKGIRSTDDDDYYD